jgi:hypothetical protein
MSTTSISLLCAGFGVNEHSEQLRKVAGSVELLCQAKISDLAKSKSDQGKLETKFNDMT